MALSPGEQLEENMLKGFRDFILRGNVVDLAVAVILGAAFNAIVTSLVGDVLNPLIAATIGKPDFSNVIINVGNGHIKVGSFLNAAVRFSLWPLWSISPSCLPSTRSWPASRSPRPMRHPPSKPAPNASAKFRWPPSAAPTAPSQ